MYAPNKAGGYIGKSKLKGVKGSSVRSKSMRSGLSRRSQLSKRKPTKRFNEELDVMSRKSKASYHPSKQSVKNYAPQPDQQQLQQKSFDYNQKLQAGKSALLPKLKFRKFKSSCLERKGASPES